ncbi:hypothetical protein AAFF_G00131950 [Aldrovandia affinis]|uniref:Docking protein 2 n=1 Tax=Aldrovandia affinis TaxID=143900 RepID=A0AAD7RQY3_9TELE|nr:hypothetical protein AAFF_G00131950 [Aldrovandia affinis]
MEEAIRKRGVLYIQQQKFGKKWKKVWSIVYGDSNCSVSRLELYERRDDAEQSERKGGKRSKRETRKVIRTSDFVRVSEERESACPRGCGCFLLETTEKSFLFAVEMSELDDWIRTLCEIAFPTNQGQCDDLTIPSVQDCGMVDNSIYCTSTALNNFEVTVERTEASERCQLRGAFILRVDFHGLHLQKPESGVIHFTWPYRHIRKFGLNMFSFSFEAGRRSDSGEGLFEFKTKQNDRIFQAVDGAIDLQRRGDGRQASDLGCRPVAPDDSDLYSTVNKVKRPHPPVDGLLVGLEEMTLDDRALPFRDWGRGMSSHPLPNPNSHLEPSPVSQLPHRLYHEPRSEDQELAGSETEPDYEEVDIGAMAAVVTQAPLALYDDVKEAKGHAWMLGMALDPVGQKCPYNPGADERAIPRQLKRMLTNPHFDCDKDDR